MRYGLSRSDNGVGDVGHYPQPLLSPGVPFFTFSYSIAEAPLGLLLMPTFGDPALSKGSIGQVELGRSIDDAKTPIEFGRPQGILGRPQPAANDNQLAWPLIPFPEG